MVALAGSLGADALLVAIGEAVFPTTRGFAHFRFDDYGLLTTLGVLGACAAWPLVARLSWAPRWLFLRLAVVVTLVLFAPDAWILWRGEPPRAVGVLVLMHLAIALVTYNALVRVAPPLEPSPPLELSPFAPARLGGGARRGGEPVAVAPVVTGPVGDEPVVGEPTPTDRPARGPVWLRRSTWVAMTALVSAELVLGFAAVFAVPFGRGDEWIPARGRILYVTHGALGGVLGVASLALIAATQRRPGLERGVAIAGAAGTALAAAGGILAVYHPLRLLGAALMLLGVVVAGGAYLIMAIEPSLGASDPLRATPDGAAPAGAPHASRPASDVPGGGSRQ